jgi:hypothetical protein
MAGLRSDVEDTATLGEQRGDKGVTQVVGTQVLEAGRRRGGLEHAPSPVSVVVVGPRLAISAREDKDAPDRTAGGLAPFGQVLGKRRE